MNAFPSIDCWQHVICPDDDPKFGREPCYSYYQAKYEIARRLSPQRIAEIGVRYGYSAWAMLCAAPTAEYTGFDAQAGTHGGVKGVNTFDYVGGLLGMDYPEATIELRRLDTQRLDSLGGPFDLIHVDGDHSERGCRHDLNLAWSALAPGGAILVDDYDYIAGVRRAVKKFCIDNPASGRLGLYIPTLRGDYLIRKGVE